MLDHLLRGGTVVDGTGAPGARADVGIHDGRVVAVGTVDEPAARVIDAEGMVVAPGFVDVHTHYDAQLMWDPLASPSSIHGVTTVLGGNCGFTIAPAGPGDADYLLPMLARVEGMPAASLRAGLDWQWKSFGDWLARFDGRIAVNAGFLAGHSTIRRAVMGAASVGESATDEQLAAMAALLHECLADGALGFSSSWGETHNDHFGDPVPSRSADAAELFHLAATLRDHPGTSLEFVPTVSHTFAERQLEVMTGMAAAAGCPLNWNVLIVRSDEETEQLSRLGASDHAAARGASVVALTLPQVFEMWLSFSTGVMLDSLPGWIDVMRLPPRERIQALSDHDVRRRLAEGAARSTHWWSRFADMTVTQTFAPANAGCAGRTIRSMMTERGETEPLEVLLDIVVADELRTVLYPAPMGDDERSWQMRGEIWRDPRVVVGGSDAGAHLDLAAAFTAHTRFLGSCVRDRQLIELEEAIRLVTDVPARLYGLDGRGRVAPGFWADLVVFDPATIGPGPVTTRDDLPAGASRIYADAVGISHVLVNGTEILDHSRFTGDLPGTVLRSGRSTGHPSAPALPPA